MTADNLLMQFIADVLNIPVMRPMAIETVSLEPRTPPGWPSAIGLTWRCCAATGTARRSGCQP